MHSLFRRANKAPAGTLASPPAPMPMLSFPGKKALRFAGDTSAAERDSELAVLMHARNHVVLATAVPGAATAAETAAALRAYLRIIYASELMAGSKQHKLRFAWRDSADAVTATGTAKNKDKHKDKAAAAAAATAKAQVQEHTSLEAERAVAMFALAAELSRAAAAEDRRGTEGTRRACAALSDAAGALKAAARAHGATDQLLCHMTEPCLVAFERLMLAQALECFFERAVAGGKHPALCSKIARQVSLDYQEVSFKLSNLQQQQQQQQQAIDKSWLPQVQAKAAYFHAEASLQYARSLREEGSGAGAVGEAVARLRFAVSVLDAAGSKTGPLGKKSPCAAAVRDAAARLRKEVEAELDAAEKDNCQVYFERVPAADVLTALPALASPLVQPTAVEAVLREADGESALANGGAPTIRH